MDGFVLKRVEDGDYVAPAGNEYSYVSDIRDARIFASREHAENERCENERVVTVASQLRRKG
jgi:hypothetical protein